jgi:uncharacterized protein
VSGGHRAGLLAALLVLAALPALAALTFPALSGRVVDQADIIPPAAEAELTARLADLEAKTSDQFVVVTLASLGDTSIEDYGYQLGRAWGIGQKGKNNGLLLIVAPNEKAVRFEVGYGLEGDLTDAVTRLIIESAILPRFRAGDMAGGIARGVDDAIQVLTGDAAAFKQRAATRPESEGTFADILPFIFFAIVIVIIINSMGRQGGRGRRPGIWLGGPGGWSSGGGGWSSGGGGFSGGGGSFGGGGSSGHW